MAWKGDSHSCQVQRCVDTSQCLLRCHRGTPSVVGLINNAHLLSVPWLALISLGFEVTRLGTWPCFLYCFPLACCSHSVCEVIGLDSVQQQVYVEGTALFKWLGHLLPKLKQECIKACFGWAV